MNAGNSAGAGVDLFEGRFDAEPFAIAADVHFRDVPPTGELLIREASLLESPQHRSICRFEMWDRADLVLKLHDLAQVVQEPSIDVGQFEDVLDRQASLQGVAEILHPVGVRDGEFRFDDVQRRLLGRAPQIFLAAAESEVSSLQTSQCFLE